MEHPENSGEYKGLAVNKGIEQPSSVNPYLKRKPKKRELSVAEFVEGIVKGDITILSQAVTLVESVKPEHQVVAQEVIEKCLPHSGNSVRIGISCNICGGKGCPFCKHTGWVEILGCGMVDPNVLESNGIDSKVYSGYALGMGIERITNLKYQVKDLRMFSENDTRFLKEFESAY